jgi:threonine/homoserine/homoserine lactone efflux protein
MKHGKVFLSGILISFFSNLPLGVFNIAALQVLIGNGVSDALLFIAGCIMAEMVYLRISLHSMHNIIKYEPVLRVLSWVFLVLIIIMAVSSFASSADGNGHIPVLFLDIIPPFILGFLLMGVNITQIPFWFGWNAVLFIKKILVSEQACYNVYALGIFIGSFLGYCLFIGFGQFVFKYLHSSQLTLNEVIGSIFCLSAILHYLKIRSRSSNISEEAVR